MLGRELREQFQDELSLAHADLVHQLAVQRRLAGLVPLYMWLRGHMPAEGGELGEVFDLCVGSLAESCRRLWRLIREWRDMGIDATSLDEPPCRRSLRLYNLANRFHKLFDADDEEEEGDDKFVRLGTLTAKMLKLTDEAEGGNGR